MKRYYKLIYLLPLLCFITTEDFHVFHIFYPDSMEINFRLGKYNKLSRLWYQRADLKTPSEYINNVYEEGDIIVVGAITSAYYLKKPYINYINYETRLFRNMSRKRGTEEIWTGRPLIFNLNDFYRIVPKNNKSSLWVIFVLKDFYGSSFDYSKFLDSLSNKRNIDASLRYVGIDERIGVWELKQLHGKNH